MQNIDPLLILQPALSVAMSVAAVVYWRRRRGFKGVLLLLALVAYAAAIMAKVAIQAVTYQAALAYFGAQSVGLGLYFGLQTVFLEVGLAFVFASLAAGRRAFSSSDGVAYGISLGFWEDAVLLGALSVLNLVADYVLIATGSNVGQMVYTALMNASPSLFQPPSLGLLSLVLLGTLERLTSLLAHIAWGTLCMLAVVTRKKRYLAYALPMGLLDALVPFANLNLGLFEGGIFLLSMGFITVAWLSVRGEEQRKSAANQIETPQEQARAIRSV